MSIRALQTAATGMAAMQDKLDVVANNLANVETTAFKRGRINFQDLFYQNDKLPGIQDSTSQLTTTGIAYGLGTRVESIQSDHTQGTLQQTSNQLDLAIQGRGFFRVLDPSGETLYTRSGNFSRNANGEIVVGSASIGRKLDPPISIPQDATEISISADGIVSVMQPGNTNMTQVGQIQLASFVNPQGLLKLGENLYSQTDSSGAPTLTNPGQTGMGTVNQGFLEASNVEPTTELIDLIKTQRAFELNSQVIQAGDQILQNIANLRR